MTTTSAPNPEIGRAVRTGGFDTNVIEAGTGRPTLFLHGSGPGVSAYANWRLPIGRLQDHLRIIAPDLVGFGFTVPPPGVEYSRETWLAQLVALIDALELETVDVVGNSFGGSMALALAIHHPERVGRLVLMGSVGVPFELTDGLDAVWGYEPSVEAMGRLMRETFAYDPGLVTDEMVRGRYEASIRPGAQEQFAAMFPAPRQRWVDAMAFSESEIRAVTAPTLIVHGRDDVVIPLANSLTLLDWIDDSVLHVFGRCGHWTQIEHADAFAGIVRDFLTTERTRS